MNKDYKKEVLEIIGRQREALIGIKSNLSKKLPVWRDRTMRFLEGSIVEGEIDILSDISGDSWEQEQQLFLEYLNDLENGTKNYPHQYLLSDPFAEKLPPKIPMSKSDDQIKSNRVFIVHGHDSLAKTDVARTLEKLGLEAIVLHEQPSAGKTIIEKFERDASQVGFAIVLITPDDIGYPKNKPDNKKPRARQNVILELGYFSGALGRSNVCVLYKGDVEIPSDYLGVVYINMDDGGAWKFHMSKELKQAGLPVDLNKLL